MMIFCLSLFFLKNLAADLVLLLGSEIILDVEGLADLLRGLALDHVSDGLAEMLFEIILVRFVLDSLFDTYTDCS
jgi:hypothetical protein